MCDGCEPFFQRKKGVIRAAAVAESNRFIDVEDLISDIYFRVLQWKQRTDSYLDVSNGLFYTVAKNLAIDCYRRGLRKESRQVPYEEEQHESILSSEVSLEAENAARVREIVEKIMNSIERPEDRDALFSFLSGEPIPKIAERLGITPNAASVRRRRAIERAASLVQRGRF
jgi:RNA polymerase sigma factor (sigma-70 family)